MQLFYNSAEKHQHFLSHLPCKMGIGLHSFPNLDVYIGMDYPNFAYPTKTPHVLVGRPRMIMYIPVMVWSEAREMGWDRAFFERVQGAKVHEIEHEFGHVIHFTHFCNNGSDVWSKVWRLMGEEGEPSFIPTSWGSYSNAIKPYEDFANYFMNMAIGKIENVRLFQYLSDLMGVRVLTFKQDSKEYYSNHIQKQMDDPLPTINGRVYLPVRVFVEELKGRVLRDVVYDAESRSIHVLAE